LKRNSVAEAETRCYNDYNACQHFPITLFRLPRLKTHSYLAQQKEFICIVFELQ